MNDPASPLAAASRLGLAALLACVLAGCGPEAGTSPAGEAPSGGAPAVAPPQAPAAAETPRAELTPAQAEAMKHFSVERRESAEAAVGAVEEAERRTAQAVEEATQR